jgi:hypothetical protein
VVVWDLMELGQQVRSLIDVGRQTRVTEVCQSLTKALKHLMLQRDLVGPHN